MAAASVSVSTPTTPLTVFITGANSGIGLGVVQLYAKQSGVRVIGTTRDLKKAAELIALTKANKNVSVVTLDVSDTKSVAALPAQLAALQPPVTAIDVLINNAGIVSAIPDHDGYSTLDKQLIENIIAVYRTNVVGAWDVTNTLLPLLRASKAPKLIHISSAAGQFAFTLDGPLLGLGFAYRASKSALNQLAALQSREYNAPHVAAHAAAAAAPADAKLQAAATAALPLVTVIAIHPGAVVTPILSQLKISIPKEYLKTVVESADGIAKVIAAAKPEAKAKFWDAIEQKEMTW